MIQVVKIFNDLIGHTITITKHDSDELTFKLENGQTCSLYHEQECCESVSIEDVSGDFSILLDSPLLAVSEVISYEDPPGHVRAYQDDSFTWTTYTFTTAKGSVVIRWYGGSNGYYSEDVNFRVHNY